MKNRERTVRAYKIAFICIMAASAALDNYGVLAFAGFVYLGFIIGEGK